MTGRALFAVAVAAVCWLAGPPRALGYAVTYTVDSALSSLTLSGQLDGAKLGPQGAAGSLSDSYSGTIAANYSAGTATFSGGSKIVAAKNPLAPFLPPNAPPGFGSVDNYGASASSDGGTVNLVLRDFSLDINLGSITNNAVPAGMNLPLYGFAQSEIISGTTGGSVGFNSTAQLAKIELGPTGIEKITIPILRDWGSLLHLTLTGNLVASRQLKAGDANNDGKVTGADYTIWAANFGKFGSWSQGDFTGDGKVTGADYTIWAANFQGGASSDPMQTVPEPASWSLAAVAVIVLACGYGRRKRRCGTARPWRPL